MIGVENLMTIRTGHVDRNNLTIPTFMIRFTRLSQGFSKKLANLNAACALHVAYFYCCRSRQNAGGPSPAHSGDTGGHCAELWTMERLYDEVMAA